MYENNSIEKVQEHMPTEQVECLNCGGQGYIWLSTYTGAWDMDTCPDCLGTGKVEAIDHSVKINDTEQ